MMDALKDNLRMLRKKKDMRQADVADAIGIARGTYASYESGITPPTDNLVRIAQYYGVSTDYLLGLTDKIKPVPQGPELDEGLIRRLCQLNPYQMQRVRDYIQGLLDAQDTP